ncbi:AMP-binding protein [Methylopila musalis]|uniref:AMP-binding protein n=1 Tax=Methylopila musalis TaxID=1134781 RepID=A0ABW3Z3D3_9HYPH
MLRTLEADGRETATPHHEVLDEALRFAAGLRRAGLGAGDVAILATTDVRQFLVAFFGMTTAGVAAAPTGAPRLWTREDPVAARLAHIARLSGARAVLLDSPGLGEDLLPPGLVRLSFEASGGDGLARKDVHRWSADDTALFACTSGSTGAPKGVPLSARNLWTTPVALGPALGLAAGEVAVNLTGLDHVASLIGFCGAALNAGASLGVISVARFLAEPQDALKRFEDWGATVSWAPDFAWGLVADQLSRPSSGVLDLSSFRALFSGGECPLEATFARLRPALERHGAHGVELRTSWGMAETTSMFTFSQPWDGNESHLQRSGVVDSGFPLPGARARVVDEAGVPVAQGEVGRFEVAGSSVFQGYLTDGETPAPTGPDGWFATGDLAAIERGRVMMLGREKDVLVLAGQNVAQVSIEDLVNRLDGVEPSFTVAVSARERLSGRSSLILFFAPKAEATAPDDLAAATRRIAGAVGAAYGVRPDVVLPLDKASIPKTGLGKLQRTLLRERFVRGDYDHVLRRMDLLLGNDRTVPARLHLRRRAVRRIVRPLSSSMRPVILVGERRPAERLALAIVEAGAKAVRCASMEEAVERLRPNGAVLVDLAAAAASDPQEQARRVEVARRAAQAAAGAPLRLVWLDRMEDADAGGALAATLRHEFTNVSTLSLTIPDAIDDTATARLADALLTSPGQQTSWATLRPDGAIETDVLEPAPAVDSGLWAAPPDDALVLVPGGAGVAGRVLLPQLLAWTSWRFLVLGRRPRSEIEAALGEITSATADAQGRLAYRRLDAGDATAMAALAAEGPSLAINLAGAATRSPISEVSAEVLARSVEARLAVARGLDAALRPAGGAAVHVTSVYADFGRRDFLAYGLTHAAHGRWIAERPADGARHVELRCGQWRSPDGVDERATHMERLGYGSIDGASAAAAVLRALFGGEAGLVLGLDRNGSEIRPHVAAGFTPLDRVVLRPSVTVSPALLRAIEDGAAAEGLADLWREVLPEGPRSRGDDFFDLGGHSLAAARLVARVRRDFDVDLSVRSVFETPALAAMADLVGRLEVDARRRAASIEEFVL